ncbi:hypothetical protein [Bdellovibrio sp. KM01]|uniref:hypothetical protein n=1 Tax=Bdellovibrio sp. KM01 TaxID=2748865 RepID=UPI0015E9E439|nr:hypothetical protein [Bdellovibrio sp. KM01]QLY26992.1 hypothetical protein HW988_08365 [Bdellovibrio sp. KM01]
MKTSKQKGNAILQVLTAIAVMSISFYFLSAYVISQRRQVVKTKNVVNLKFAVNSAMDYVVFGIRQKYCFDNGSLLQNTTSCDWNNPGNVERLVMSDEQLASLKGMVAAGANIGPHDSNLDKLRLDFIDMTLNFPVSSAHPLFPVVNNLKRVVDEQTGKEIPVQGIRMYLSRPANSGYLPKAGREVYVSAQISLIDKNKNVIQIGSAPLEVRAQIAIYPRELGSFALVLPGDLRMDRTWDSVPPKNGDVIFHKFANKATMGTSPGMIFKSPVFVNGNINLPVDSGNASNSNYAGVTFADRVYMGNGWILKPDNSPYNPPTQGALPDRYWSDSRVFGGFLRGIENDGMRDLGLDVMSGTASGSSGTEFDLNKICAELNQKSTQLESMEASNIKATPGKNPDDPYRVVLTNYNTFYPQKNQLPAPTTSGDWSTGKWSIDNKNKITGAIMNVEFSYGTGADARSFSVDLVKDGNVTIFPPVLNPARKAAIVANLNQANTDYKNAKNSDTSNTDSLTKLKKKLNTAESELSDLEDQLDAELAKPVEPVAAPSPSPTATATVSPSPTATATASASPTATASATASPTATATASASPTATASPTVTATTTATVSPTVSPTVTPPPGGYQDADKIKDLKAQISAKKSEISDLKNQITAAETNSTNYTKAMADAQNNIAKYTAQLDAYTALEKNPPSFEIDLDKAYSWTGKEYKDRLDVLIGINNGLYLMNAAGVRIADFSIRLKGYDGTYYNSIPVRSTADPAHLRGYLNYHIGASGNITRPTGLSSTSSTGDTSEDTADMAAKCEDYYNMINSQSFGAANWGVSFSPGTRKSWNFAGDLNATAADPVVPSRTWTMDDQDFYVRSIVKDCVITPKANFVAGFYTCDNLTIQGGRTKPLRIIGTFIIGKTLKIDEQAIRTGIVWSSIYYPQATQELRERGILHPLSEPSNITKCDNLPSPIWHPMPSIQETADRMACNVISLRAKADPFKWTAVDPDCGIPVGATQTVPTCKRRIYHYFVVEQSREGSGL